MKWLLSYQNKTAAKNISQMKIVGKRQLKPVKTGFFF
jgi:hypothetical protein